MRMTTITPLRNKRSLHSSHNSSTHNNIINSKTPATRTTNRRVNQTTKALSRKINKHPNFHPAPQAMVNSAGTAKYLTTRRKSAVKESETINHVSLTKASFTGPRSTPQLKTIIPIMLVRFFFKEHHGTPHECSQCHSTTDFKFVYNLNRYIQ
jgi:hypothetical protein